MNENPRDSSTKSSQNAASRNDVIRLEQKVADFEVTVSNKLNRIKQEIKTSISSVTTDVRHALDEVTRVQQSLSTIKHSFTGTADQMQRSVQQDFKRVASQIKSTVSAGSNDIVRLINKNSIAISGVEAAFGQQTNSLDRNTVQVQNLESDLEDIKRFLNTKFRTIVQTDRQKNITTTLIIANQKTINKKQSRFAKLVEKFLQQLAIQQRNMHEKVEDYSAFKNFGPAPVIFEVLGVKFSAKKRDRFFKNAFPARLSGSFYWAILKNRLFGRKFHSKNLKNDQISKPGQYF